MKAGRIKTAARFGVLALSLALLVLGFFSGEAEEIWRKAVMICLECVGIG